MNCEQRINILYERVQDRLIERRHDINGYHIDDNSLYLMDDVFQIIQEEFEKERVW